MRRRWIWAMVWGLVLLPWSYPAQGTTLKPLGMHQISIIGATSLIPLTKRFLPEWERRHPGVVVSVTAGGSWAGILAVAEGQADIGMADLAPPPKRALRLDSYPAGRLAVAFIANSDDGVKNLSRLQLVQVLQGRIHNWQTLGGHDTPVIVVSRPMSSGARAMLDRLVPAPGLSADAIIQLSNGAVLKTVRETPGAIGYVEWRPGMGGVTMLGIDHQVFDTSRLAAWPYYTQPTFYVAPGASSLVKQLAEMLSRSPYKAEFGIYRAQGIPR